MRNVNTDGNVSNYYNAGDDFGVRLVVTLRGGAVISSGDGSEESPFIISV